ncbi:hypothetical protein ARZXY2_4256 [Arthrobacter sp. ZXY-2]|nr:hypothetical protein ARZXY2_4256 [Arthrobacter sp. ZXY-2]
MNLLQTSPTISWEAGKDAADWSEGPLLTDRINDTGAS